MNPISSNLRWNDSTRLLAHTSIHEGLTKNSGSPCNEASNAFSLKFIELMNGQHRCQSEEIMKLMNPLDQKRVISGGTRWPTTAGGWMGTQNCGAGVICIKGGRKLWRTGKEANNQERILSYCSLHRINKIIQRSGCKSLQLAAKSAQPLKFLEDSLLKASHSHGTRCISGVAR